MDPRRSARSVTSRVTSSIDQRVGAGVGTAEGGQPRRQQVILMRRPVLADGCRQLGTADRRRLTPTAASPAAGHTAAAHKPQLVGDISAAT